MQHSGLQGLNINDTKVTDDGMIYLKELRSLEMILMDNTQITDAGLRHLKKLTNLESLQLRGTQITAEGVKRFNETLPNCKIYWDGK